MSILKELSTYKPIVKESNKRAVEYEQLLESIEDLMEKFSLFGNKDKVTDGKLTMSKIHTVVLSPGDGGIELKDKVFGIRNEDPIVDFMLQAMGVPMDGMAIRIRSGFMQYDKRSKMLFIAKFKSDLPNERSGKLAESKSSPLEKYSKWYEKNDLWHPKFSEVFTDCFDALVKTPGIDVEILGRAIADEAHSFSAEDMTKFVEYVKKNPIPEYDGNDEDEEQEFLGDYVKKALKKM